MLKKTMAVLLLVCALLSQTVSFAQEAQADFWSAAARGLASAAPASLRYEAELVTDQTTVGATLQAAGEGLSLTLALPDGSVDNAYISYSSYRHRGAVDLLRYQDGVLTLSSLRGEQLALSSQTESDRFAVTAAWSNPMNGSGSSGTATLDNRLAPSTPQTPFALTHTFTVNGQTLGAFRQSLVSAEPLAPLSAAPCIWLDAQQLNSLLGGL